MPNLPQLQKEIRSNNSNTATTAFLLSNKMAAVKLHATFGKLLSSLPSVRPKSQQILPLCNQMIFTRNVTRRLARNVGNTKPRGPTKTGKSYGPTEIVLKVKDRKTGKSSYL